MLTVEKAGVCQHTGLPENFVAALLLRIAGQIFFLLLFFGNFSEPMSMMGLKSVILKFSSRLVTDPARGRGSRG